MLHELGEIVAAAKPAALAVLTVVAGVFSAVYAQAEPVASVLTGAATLGGLAFLVWKLVADNRTDEEQKETYRKLVEELQGDRDELRRRLAEAEQRIRDLTGGGSRQSDT